MKMNKLQLGLYVRGHWEMQHGNREAAFEAFNSLGNNPFAKATMASIYASEHAPFEKLIAAYRDAIECGAEELLLLYSKMLDHIGGQENELKTIVQRIEEGVERKNAKIIAGFFEDRMAIGDFEGAALACNEAIQLRNAKTMSDLAQILLMPTGNEELIYFLSDKEIFDPKPWPVAVAVSIPDSKLFDLEGNVQGDRKAQQEAIREEIDSRRKFTNFVRSLFDQGEEQPLHSAGRLRAIFEITEDSNWTSRMVNEFSKSSEKTSYFWEDPDLILFYTEQLVSSNIHFEVEWIRPGISEFGLEDIFDRTIALALDSEDRKFTEENQHIGSTRPHIYLGERELTIYEGFSETAGENQALITRVMANPYCKLFDEGRLTDLKSILAQDSKLACQGAESLFEDLSLFIALGSTYGSQGFIEIIERAIDQIREAADPPREFVSQLATIWLEVGRHRFDEENYAVNKLPEGLLEIPKLDEGLRGEIEQFFPNRKERERLDAIFISILEKLRSGINAIPELSEALLSFYESNPDDEDFVYWYWTETIIYELLEVLENNESLWGESLVALTLIISEWDPHFACNVISTDTDFDSAHLTSKDLEALSQNQDCNDYECDGPREHASQHPNFS